MITLYDYALSGNCFKVRYLLKALHLEFSKQPVDFYPGFEHRSDKFLKLNPLGQLPVLDDAGLIIRDAQAILVHLAAQYDPSFKWYPLNRPSILGQIQIWLAFADSLTSTISASRLHDAMFFTLDADGARRGADRLLRVMDEHLWFSEQSGHKWLCEGADPTIADVACFPYVALSEEGGVSLEKFPAIVRWCDRFMSLDDFEPMAGMIPLPLPKSSRKP
ncbi:MAG: glutathione S-transferase family protein [Afipia felis]|nr:glutathione S-transferase family protein [Afipia felis]